MFCIRRSRNHINLNISCRRYIHITTQIISPRSNPIRIRSGSISLYHKITICTRNIGSCIIIHLYSINCLTSSIIYIDTIRSTNQGYSRISLSYNPIITSNNTIIISCCHIYNTLRSINTTLACNCLPVFISILSNNIIITCCYIDRT